MKILSEKKGGKKTLRSTKLCVKLIKRPRGLRKRDGKNLFSIRNRYNNLYFLILNKIISFLLAFRK